MFRLIELGRSESGETEVLLDEVPIAEWDGSSLILHDAEVYGKKRLEAYAEMFEWAAEEAVGL